MSSLSNLKLKIKVLLDLIAKKQRAIHYAKHSKKTIQYWLGFQDALEWLRESKEYDELRKEVALHG